MPHERSIEVVPPRWPRNPYALAELVAAMHGRDVRWSLTDDAAQIARWLRIKPAGRAWQGSGPITLLDLYRDGGWVEKGFDTLIDAVRSLRGHAPWLLDEFGESFFRQLLPYLVPVRDAEPPGASTQPPLAPTALRRAGLAMTDRSGATFLDPVQGILNDCYLIAPMISVAWSLEHSWERHLRERPIAGDADFSIRLFPDRQPFAVSRNVPVWIDPDRPNRRIFTYTRSNDAGESWPAIVEKAFALRLKHPDGTPPAELSLADYHVLNNKGNEELVRSKWPQIACARLCGGTPRPPRGVDEFQTALDQTVTELRALCHDARARDCATRQPVMATTKDADSAGQDATLFETDRIASGLVAEHCYAVLGLARREEGEYVVLRNPWSQRIDPAPGNWLQGDWSPDAGSTRRRVKLNQLGVFAVPEIEFARYFLSYCTVAAPELV